MTLKKIAALLALAGIASPAFATNGMNMEGYGPIATGMGGASMAYDNGTAAAVNNPTTLGLMASDTMRLDVALGQLGPDVNSSMPGFGNAPSSGDSYIMPALGFVAKTGKLAYGVGVFAQGGMGTEYGTNSFMSMGSGKEARSELGVGRAMLPLVYSATDALSIGGSIDFVWAGLDLRMPMSAAAMGDMWVGSKTLGSISVTPNLATALGTAMGSPTAYGGYFDFSNSNDFTGKANATGWAGKIGFTYKLSPQFTIGGVYQSETSLGDLETDSNASMTVLDTAGNTTMTGKIKIKDRKSVV
jgi:long-chain fatty acid transport protein